MFLVVALGAITGGRGCRGGHSSRGGRGGRGGRSGRGAGRGAGRGGAATATTATRNTMVMAMNHARLHRGIPCPQSALKLSVEWICLIVQLLGICPNDGNQFRGIPGASRSSARR